MVEYLKEHNIPLFAPLTINSLVEDWENDPMGMSGGFLSQSVVTPEIDGAIRPGSPSLPNTKMTKDCNIHLLFPNGWKRS